MGPGGSRGLQILRSGASRVRGGFDSHAFPPLCALLAVALLATAGRAQSPPPQPGVGPAPPAAAGSAPGAETSGRPPTKQKQPFDEPRYVMLRSLVVPGWGQAYNRAWLKAGGVAAVEVTLIVRLRDDKQELDRLNAAVDDARLNGSAEQEALLVEQYNKRLESYTARQWWFGATLAYSLLDAYIDAHFRGFKVEFENDPALPGGVPPSGGRVGLRWNF